MTSHEKDHDGDKKEDSDDGDDCNKLIMEAKENLQHNDTMKDESSEAKLAFEELKKQGYKEVKTSFSKWEINFSSTFCHDEKAAVVHFVYDMMTRAR